MDFFGARATRLGAADRGLAVLVVAAAALLGLMLRLHDPTSSPVIAAEDPFTHIALTQEHLATGRIDSLYDGSVVYPPGFHALLAAVSVWTGLSLYTLAIYLPPALGAIGIVGIALVAWCPLGRWPATLAASVLAIIPEAIFRSSMLSPTALDLAVLPFLLLALLRVMGGQWRWIPASVLLTLFQLFSHPWAFGVLATGGAATLGFCALRGSQNGGQRLDARGCLIACALVGSGLGLGMMGCGGWCGPGFDRIMALPGLGPLGGLGALLVAIAVAPILAWGVLLLARRLQWLPPAAPERWTQAPTRWAKAGARWRRPLLSAAFVLALFFVLRAAVRDGLPEFVGIASFGWPALALAAIGLAAAPWVPGPTSMLAVGLFWGTLPFVVFNPLHSEFWPHRTMVYLALAVALLAACALQAVLVHLLPALHRRSAGLNLSPRLRILVPLGLTLAVVGAADIGVVASAPPPFSWYRLYEPCEDEALRSLAQEVAHQPESLVIAGDWQAKLVLAAYTSNTSRIWFDRAFFTDPLHRANVVEDAMRHGHTVHVVVERNLAFDLAFLNNTEWRLDNQACASGSSVRHYELPDRLRFVPKSLGDPWWIEVDALAPQPVDRVEWHTGAQAWQPLQRTVWGSWSAAQPVPVGSIVEFRATLRDGRQVTSNPLTWVEGAAPAASIG